MGYPGIKEPQKAPEPPPMPDPREDKATKALLNLMKMSPEELANQIFPAGA
jgi:hypothetical protein